MATGPENKYIAGVHRKLPGGHAEKMHNPYRRGTPDVFYSGMLSSLWVEYKFIAKIPKSANILPELSQSQLEWCEARYREGRAVAVIVGSPEGGVVFRHLEWMSPMPADIFRRRLQPKEDIALWIHSQIGDAACRSSLISLTPTK